MDIPGLWGWSSLDAGPSDGSARDALAACPTNVLGLWRRVAAQEGRVPLAFIEVLQVTGPAFLASPCTEASPPVGCLREGHVMRLSTAQVGAILTEVARWLGPEASVWLYGSRLRDDRRGGDVDLMLVVTVRPSPRELACLRDGLETVLGLPVDLLVKVASEPATDFQEMIVRQARRLGEAA